ncbi:MAG: ATP-binding cassette domain-containing protein [Luteococcus sp.]|uniref:ABC transporter ATP-binding protein n=1 Tax=Luteococcus sp. TaxID=1969402 RepID=UPI002647EA22|nr:ATP-binding cassette domain-containing protein [Luteococcus sp.]MDN5562252.1 ATP-binding cassette domain-containing protein [Luteococcus sp.]
MPSSSTVIETIDVSHRFGRKQALTNVNMRVRAGRIYGLIGPNGAGKSTLLGTLLGLIEPTQGSVRMFGMPWTPDALLDIGASINGPAFYPQLTAQENLKVHALLTGVDDLRIAEVLQEVGLGGAGRARAKSFSTGMKGRLALAMAMLADPEVLILDEPQNGLDPEGIQDLRRMLRTWADAGRTVIVSSHMLDEVAHVADDIGVLVAGELRYQGTLQELERQGTLEKAFFTIVGSAA